MKPTSTKSSVASWRIVAFVLLLCLSFIVPMATIQWFGQPLLSGKYFAGVPRTERQYEFGTIVRGELWFPVRSYLKDPGNRPFESRLHRLDLKTGIERETPFVFLNEQLFPSWFGGELYLNVHSINHRIEGDRLIPISPPPKETLSTTEAFLHDDKLTMVTEVGQNRFRLIHYVDETWVDGREFFLPRSGHAWFRDSGSEKMRLLPENSITGGTLVKRPGGTGFHLCIQPARDGKSFHIHVQDDSGFAAYRNGLRFIENQTSEVTAVSPENESPADSNWEPLPPFEGFDQRTQLRCDDDGALFSNFTTPGRQVLRRSNDGEWKLLGNSNYSDVGGSLWIINDLAEGNAYVVLRDVRWNTAAFCRIEGNTIHSPLRKIPGMEREFLAAWKSLLVGILLAWTLHNLLVMAGVCASEKQSDIYEFGDRRVSIASMRKRCLSGLVDLLVITSLSIGVSMWHSKLLSGLTLKNHSETEYAEYLFSETIQFRFCMQSGDVRTYLNNLAHSLPSFLIEVPPHPSLISSVSVAFYSFVFLSCIRAFFEGRFGMTPGNWLFGIRTMRSTLRPCGFARALLRDLLCWFDILVFITAIPAAISMFLSHCNQRLGDKLADTIVINATGLNSPK